MMYDYSIIKTEMRKSRALQPLQLLINNFLSRLLCPY
uniref:Ring finger protein, putative n=1 Tax=Arundo donax TaxID=35708 RepID=A0A0A8ZG64_ARUDO